MTGCKLLILGTIDSHLKSLRLVHLISATSRHPSSSLVLAKLLTPETDDTPRTHKTPSPRIDSMQKAIRHTELTLMRSATTEVFELLKAYCQQSNQLQTMESEPWFKFIRLVRNALNHDFKLRFSSSDLQSLPIEWNGIQITEKDNGQEVTLDHLPLSAVEEWLWQAEVCCTERLA